LAFETLTEKITLAFKRLTSKGKLTENDVKASVREVRLALLEADVNYRVAKNFTDKIVESAIGANVMESLTPAQMVIKIVREELVALLGSKHVRLEILSKFPGVIMMCGLQGSGKTTHSAKLAKMLKKQGHRPLLAACDVYRPAAIKQLQVLASSIEVQVFEQGQCKPADIAKNAVIYAKVHGYDVVIIDTAGRLHIDDGLMDELLEIKKGVDLSEILLVVDAMTGQDAVNVAEAFDHKLGITGVLLTKIDGDARGGAVLSVRAVTGKPIKFVGNGEKLDDIEIFHPDRIASRILGMGDVLTLIENAQVNFDKKQAEKLAQKLEKNSFDLNDLMLQFEQIKKLGSVKSILGRLPGVGRYVKDVDIDDKIFGAMSAIILSMTIEERKKPELINASRKKRIARGSGSRVEDINKLLKQFEQMQKMMKQFGGKKKNFLPRFGFPRMPGMR
jgi:signal recognition particle subunit SRP54